MRKTFITDKMKSIYVAKYYGEKLSDIVKRYNIKCHSLIYYYVEAVESEMYKNVSLEQEIKQKKDEYKRNLQSKQQS